MAGAEAGAGPSDLAGGLQPGPQPSTIIYQGKKGYKMVRQYLMGDLLGEGAQGKVKEAVRARARARVWVRARGSG